VSRPVLEDVGLTKHYPLRGALFGTPSTVHALDGVSLSLAKGETLALVGESGCGKSTLAKCVMRLVEPSAGTIHVDGRDITRASTAELRASRRVMQIIFQNPYASLNPRRSVYQAIADPLRLHAVVPARQRRARAADLLRQVGLGGDYLDRYPHELSGGQQQRVAIARALAVEPKVIICDEPVSALDVSVQAQVVNLLLRLQAELGLSYIFITHNLALARRISHRLAVMYLGQIVELVDSGGMRAGPMHPYSQALFAAAPVADPRRARGKPAALSGEPSSPIDPPAGCRFEGRCAYRRDDCVTTPQTLSEVNGRQVRCRYAGHLRPAAPSPEPVRSNLHSPSASSD
jgi:oligopeptide/dipeptide ABC transporter ATP-binding protein